MCRQGGLDGGECEGWVYNMIVRRTLYDVYFRDSGTNKNTGRRLLSLFVFLSNYAFNHGINLAVTMVILEDLMQL